MRISDWSSDVCSSDLLRPDRFEDIIAVVALYRPGPMDNIPSYIRRKHGDEKPDYLHPDLEGILKETYGIMIYQEQVMQIAQVLSGYTLGSAEIGRAHVELQSLMRISYAVFCLKNKTRLETIHVMYFSND